MDTRLVIVLVLYQKKLAESPSYDILQTAVSENETVDLFIYDNSEQAQKDSLFDLKNVHYIHDAENSGLAKAYNAGAEWLKKCKGRLLMLLDQDTVVALADIEQILALPETEIETVGVFVPFIRSGNQQISPVFSDTYISRERSFPQTGVTDQALMAINSGTVLTEKGLMAVEAFNESFPLDFLDHWVFWTLHQKGLKIEVLPLTFEHDLSVLDYSSVSLKRYESIISAESLFYREYDQKKLDIHTKHLLKRTLKQFLLVKNRAIWRRTWKEYRKLVRDSK
ncbi:glycosyltransferase [Enterococcus sp. BWB1-3]|uniref:glycosyltransferase n=1 Tax=Enterococcus sp. BWB1-3 TaxID=2787713 RepID=UPI001924C9C2|nr:glycosyltransferase [Enterococcus sp. BWB1-3]MBL1230765.1 glycosyltransferase [Enterococcus sp. BWB1-3]